MIRSKMGLWGQKQVNALKFLVGVRVAVCVVSGGANEQAGRGHGRLEQLLLDHWLGRSRRRLRRSNEYLGQVGAGRRFDDEW